MTEIWKPIDGFGGRYEVSNTGKVRSFTRKSYKKDGKILTPNAVSSGYFIVHLSDGKNKKAMLIHRLVAMTFVPNPNNYPQINHIDENKKNNNADNLEWCTAAYNLAYGSAPEKRRISRSKPCIGTWADGTERRFESTCHVERELGIFHGHVSKACNGKLQHAGKIAWRWENERSKDDIS